MIWSNAFQLFEATHRFITVAVIYFLQCQTLHWFQGSLEGAVFPAWPSCIVCPACPRWTDPLYRSTGLRHRHRKLSQRWRWPCAKVQGRPWRSVAICQAHRVSSQHWTMKLSNTVCASISIILCICIFQCWGIFKYSLY